MLIRLYLGLVPQLYRAMTYRWKLSGMTRNKVSRCLRRSAGSSILTIYRTGKYTTLCFTRLSTRINFTITCFAPCRWIIFLDDPFLLSRQAERGFAKEASVYFPYLDSVLFHTVHYATLPFCHSAIPPFRHPAIPPFRHSAILPFHHSVIPPFHHSAILPFRHSAIPPFRSNMQ
jgi:hypothetical protein